MAIQQLPCLADSGSLLFPQVLPAMARYTFPVLFPPEPLKQEQQSVHLFLAFVDTENTQIFLLPFFEWEQPMNSHPIIPALPNLGES